MRRADMRDLPKQRQAFLLCEQTDNLGFEYYCRNEGEEIPFSEPDSG